MRRMPVLAVLLSACGWFGAPPPPATPQAPAAPIRDTLVVAAPADLTNLNPVVYESAMDGVVVAALNEPVVTDGFACGLTPGPGLATSWEWSPDGLLLTLHLRTDARWSDGAPVTAEDVVFTYDMVRDPAVASPRRGFVDRMVPGTPVALDPHTVRFAFTVAYDRTAQLAHASLTPIPKHGFADADRSTLRGHPASLRPVGDGPWALTVHEPGKRWVLEPSATWAGPEAARPKLAKVEFVVLADPAARIAALQAGTVDWVEGLDLTDVDTLRAARPDLVVVPRGWRSNEFVAWNTRLPLFADKQLRRALSLAVHVDAMIGALLTGADGARYGRRMVGTVSPELCAAHADDIAPLPYDPEGATTLLGALGWRDSNADGVLDKDGVALAFTLRTNQGNTRRLAAARAIQADLHKIGVKVSIEPMEGAALFEALRKHDFEAALAGWNAALFADPSAFWRSDRAGAPADSNFSGYANPEVDALLDQGVGIADPAEAAAVWKEVQRKVYEDQPFTFLWWRQELVVVDARFQHTSIDVISGLGQLSAWDVPPDRVKYKP